MQPAGLYRLASSVVVLPASPKLGAVKRTFLLCSKGTLSLCCHMPVSWNQSNLAPGWDDLIPIRVDSKGDNCFLRKTQKNAQIADQSLRRAHPEIYVTVITITMP